MGRCVLPSSECAVNRVPRFANVNVNKVHIFYGIVLIPLTCFSFQCTLSLYSQCVYVHSVTADESELDGTRIAQTPEQPNKVEGNNVTFLHLFR